MLEVERKERRDFKVPKVPKGRREAKVIRELLVRRDLKAIKDHRVSQVAEHRVAKGFREFKVPKVHKGRREAKVIKVRRDRREVKFPVRYSYHRRADCLKPLRLAPQSNLKPQLTKLMVIS